MTFEHRTPLPQAWDGWSDRERVLRLLDGDADGLTISDLQARGVQMPGHALYELELDGYPIERVRRPGPDGGLARRTTCFRLAPGGAGSRGRR